ncbi:PQQ-binding-like beta-propeller repeat protein [Nonomuraea sp. NPDC059194]|uniref:outer membrane protein assembly factor BamB family protein n=1 Tax=Nonomuraea sp. NPDC059194 TaxID=3346764 RepID=UPI0036BEDC4C
MHQGDQRQTGLDGPVRGAPSPVPPRGRFVLVLAGMLILAVVAAVLVRPWDGGAGGSVDGGPREERTAQPSPNQRSELTGEQAWAVAAATDDHAGHAGSFGSWLADGLLVRAHATGVAARAVATGRLKWTLPPPDGGEFCGVGQEDSDGRAVLAYGAVRQREAAQGLTHVDCSAITLVDLATGGRVWSADLRDTGHYRSLREDGLSPPHRASLAIVRQSVVVAYGRSAVGYDLADGVKRWEIKNVHGSCAFTDVLAAPDGAVMLASCDRSYPLAVFGVDPSTGARRWRTDLTAAQVGRDSGLGTWLVSARPVVLAAAHGRPRYLVLGKDRRRVTTIPQTGEYGTLDLSPVGLSGTDRGRFRALVAGRTMVTLTTERKVNDYRSSNAVVAIDLRNAGLLWSRSLGESATAIPALIDRETAIVMRGGTYEEPPQAYRLKLVDGSGGAMGPAYSRDLIGLAPTALFRFGGKRLFLVSEIHSKVSAVALR